MTGTQGRREPDAGDARSLRVFIKSLRDKIEPDPRRPKYILTETAIGYRLCPEETVTDPRRDLRQSK